jgi:hypothetical protein
MSGPRHAIGFVCIGNETRVLSLMSALRVNSGTECVVRPRVPRVFLCRINFRNAHSLRVTRIGNARRSAILVFVSCWRNFFSRPGAFTIKAARSIRHQIIVAAQNALD